ncbi:MAG: DUF1326 domain-containing protein [Myxococcota bacterium]|nr:DUF1326 domain-containing protein [Myxococcota bacterium]
MAPSWWIEGDYFENCSCELLCPCLLSRATADPTDGKCQGVLAFHLDAGDIEGVDLAGANFAVLFETEGPMANGIWTTGFYYDANASESQQGALRRLLAGDLGGAPSVFRLVTRTFLGEKTVPMTYRIEGNTRSFTVPGLIEMNIEAITGQDGAPTWFENVVHPVASRLSAALGTRTRITDHGLDWDNAGKNGHFAPFRWEA